MFILLCAVIASALIVGVLHLDQWLWEKYAFKDFYIGKVIDTNTFAGFNYWLKYRKESK